MTRAAKPKRRPPFTTLATRLMLTSFSANSVSSRARDWPSPSPRLRRSPCVRAITVLSEIQPALAGGIGQGLDPAMIHVGAPVEHDPLHPRRQRPTGRVVDDLGVDVPRRAEHRQPGASFGGLAQLEAGALAPALKQRILLVRALGQHRGATD